MSIVVDQIRNFLAEVSDLLLDSETLTVSNNVVAFDTGVSARVYAIAANSANTTVNLTVNNGNEHYLLFKNTAASSITVAFSGFASGDTVIGTSSVEITAGKAVEISVIKIGTTWIFTNSAELTINTIS